MPADYQYCSSYCEENIWHLAQHSDFEDHEKRVALISNSDRACLFFNQQAAALGASMAWDYHVILLTRDDHWRIWDLDTRLPLGIVAEEYLRATFPTVSPEPPTVSPVWTRYLPKFRVLPASDYVAHFHSDRSHMRNADGEWLAPPPPWPTITTEAANSFLSWTEMSDANDILSLDEMHKLVTSS